MSRHEKPGRTLGTLAAPTSPFHKAGEEGVPFHSPPLAQDTQRPLPSPTSTPCADQRVCSGHQRDRANTGKAERPRDAETHSKDSPGILAAPSHTTSTQGERGGEGFHSHKDDTKQTK